MAEEVKALFKAFLADCCEEAEFGWVQLDVLHCAFLDYMVAMGKDTKWVVQMVGSYPAKTVALAVELGCIRRGTPSCCMVKGIRLVKYL